MSADPFTLDDALSNPSTQKTQESGVEADELHYKSDTTQAESSSPGLRQPENAMARMVESDLSGAGDRFRTTTKTTVATEFPDLVDPKKMKRKASELQEERTKKMKPTRVLSWKCVEVEESEKKRQILKSVNGRAHGGELTFIMGSSGAGKTTLLNVLTGRNKSGLTVKGDVLLNGRPLTPLETKRISAYVQQEDVFIGSQTVSEVLHFAIKMRSPKVLDRKERTDLVESLLTTFNLKSCEHTRIGSLKEKGISRGEKKRLAFACEILTDPPILFCDEPTSGLDSFMSHQVMKCLKGLADEGKIVVCTIHQPSTWVYQMADRLLLLCQGRVAYDGNREDVGRFLEKIGAPPPEYASISDHFIRILSRSVGEKQDEYEKRIEKILNHETTSNSHSKSVSIRSEQQKQNQKQNATEQWIRRSWCFQFFALTRRGLIQVSRRKKYIVARLILTVLVSWFLGMVYLQVPIHKDHLLGIKGVIFGTLQMNNILYMMPSLISFWEDYPVVVREFQSNMYSPSAYFMARSFTDSILHLIFPIIFFLIIYFMTGLPLTLIAMTTFLSMCIAMSMIITSLSHAVVSLCGNVTMSLTVAPLISVPVMVFGGFLITVDAVPFYYKPLSYVSWYHYAFEAVMIAFFKDVGPIDGCQKVNPQFDIECSTGLKLISDQDFAVDHFWWDFVAIGGILVFWKIFGLIAFICRIRRKT